MAWKNRPETFPDSSITRPRIIRTLRPLLFRIIYTFTSRLYPFELSPLGESVSMTKVIGVERGSIERRETKVTVHGGRRSGYADLGLHN